MSGKSAKEEPEASEELEWWESIPEVDFVEDISPDMFNFTGRPAPERPPKDDGGEQAPEELPPPEPTPKVSAATRIRYGAKQVVSAIAGIIAMLVIGSVFATYLNNVGVNPEYTIGDAANFVAENIKGLFGLIAG